MKSCGKCKRLKPAGEYHKNRSTVDGLNNYCKVCVSSWRKANRDKLKAYQQRWLSENKDRNAQADRAWRKANASRLAAHTAKRRALMLNVAAEELPMDLLGYLKSVFGDTCMHPECEETENIQIDHVVPLTKGGAHALSNLQLLCRYHNISKGNRSCADYRPAELLQEIKIGGHA